MSFSTLSYSLVLCCGALYSQGMGLRGWRVVCLHLSEHQRDAFTLDFLSPIARAVYFLRPFLLMFVCAERHQPKHAAAAVEHYLAIWCSGDLLMLRHDAKFITPRSPASTFNSTQRERCRTSGGLLLLLSLLLSLPPQRQGCRMESCKVLDHLSLWCTLLYMHIGVDVACQSYLAEMCAILHHHCLDSSPEMA